MSVPEPQRTEGKLEVIEKARELAAYTLKITKNKKIFVPDYQDTVTDEINRLAIRIHMDTYEANEVVVTTPQDYIDRRKLQQSAQRACSDLLAMIDLAKPIFHLSGRRIEYWSGKVKKERALIRGWRDKDAERYRQYR